MPVILCDARFCIGHLYIQANKTDGLFQAACDDNISFSKITTMTDTGQRINKNNSTACSLVCRSMWMWRWQHNLAWRSMCDV